jgi:hypothetical protein
MKQIVLSLILGLILPIIFFMAIGITTDYMSPSSLTEIKIYDQPAPGILLSPFSLPIYLDIILKENRIAPFIFDTTLFRISSLVLFNWTLYGTIAYFVLGKLKMFRNTPENETVPPPPPNFEQRI